MEPRISYQVHGPSRLPTTSNQFPHESLASTEKVVLGSIAFAVFWVLAVFPSVPCMPVGRTAGSLLGAMLMVIFRVMSPDEAYDAINLPILGLLFGTMVVSVYLERADMFKHLGKLLAWKSKGAKDLLCRICLISALSSAFFTNDTSCIILTEFVLKIASQRKLNPRPFLLALASSANIGSSATPIGNPQNLVIAVQSKISFMSFLVGILPAMLVGILVNTSMLLCMYWRLLSIQKDIPAAEMKDISEKWKSTMKSANQPNSPVMNENTASVEIESQTVSSDAADSARNPGTDVSNQKKDGNESPKGVAEGKETLATRWKQIWRKSSAYIVAVGMLIAFLMGLNMSWTALTAALVLVALDFKDAMPALEKVSYSLLVFFCGMFISVDGFNRTGIPNALWNLMKPYAKVDHASGIAVLAIVIVVLSNLASNVPTVLLLGGKIAASAAAVSQADVKKSWLILAWVSTVAGNLSLLGSAANLIVCEQARRNPHLRYTLSFWNHLKFGVPSTIIVAAIGLTLIR